MKCISFKTTYSEILHFPCEGIKLEVDALDEVKWMLYNHILHNMYGKCTWCNHMYALHAVMKMHLIGLNR